MSTDSEQVEQLKNAIRHLVGFVKAAPVVEKALREELEKAKNGK